MRIDVRVRHGTVEDGVEQYARDKAQRLDRYFEGILHVDIVLEAGTESSTAEMIAVLPRGHRLVGKADAEAMQSAIDLAEGKLKRQVRRFHAKLRAHRDRSRVAGSPVPEPTSEEEETYEEIVREMELGGGEES